MKVFVPTPLRSYTDQRDVVDALGASLDALLEDLDRRFPGMRFRMIDEQGGIRPHIRLFVNRVSVRRLDVPLRESDEVHILQALTGG